MEFISKSEHETEGLAARLAENLQPGDVVFLNGPLGVGKSVFARALIRCLSCEPQLDVPSPTFTLLQTYDSEKGQIWHFDLYRIKDPGEIYEIGWEEALYDGISLIEWPERLESLAPTDRLDIILSQNSEQTHQRTITFIPTGTWKNRDLKDL